MNVKNFQRTHNNDDEFENFQTPIGVPKSTTIS